MRHRYGSHLHQFGDLLVPDGSGPFPVAVVLHGGFWREQFTLDLMDDHARDLSRRGFAAWNVEYRRVGEVSGGGYPTTLEDVTLTATTSNASTNPTAPPIRGHVRLSTSIAPSTIRIVAGSTSNGPTPRSSRWC